MESKALLVIFVLATLAFAMVAEATKIHEFSRLTSPGDYDLLVDDNEFLMNSESTRRTLAQARYISYAALRANQIPCGQRGRSYYDCNKRQRANPYRRGCSRITKCQRTMD
ncbi:hypothetical protein HN51_030355 [Arachis hypogaea]|uniref:Protein RALF-like 19 n=3 Tax=Arachis TaxID=3817 RepID=A0A445BBI1_ARAHY|nr:protein RALF-like 19 [Arachis duranensis]XP_025625981.1 protein RALF-like 19 [Arachis hypogaea]QHO14831.1 Protein RALF-like [Arachis hypogaea]RYR36032.1 hypothetical protein Ahy_A10g051092 isoform A [Arachis hypogaea]